jgi:hypothetical protein
MSDLDSPIQPSMTDEHWVYAARLLLRQQTHAVTNQGSVKELPLSNQRKSSNRNSYLLYLLLNLVMLLIGMYLLLQEYHFGAGFIGAGTTNVSFLAISRR